MNRSASEVRTAITKSGGKVADPGSVLFNFERRGLVWVAPSEDEDKVWRAGTARGGCLGCNPGVSLTMRPAAVLLCRGSQGLSGGGMRERSSGEHGRRGRCATLPRLGPAAAAAAAGAGAAVAQVFEAAMEAGASDMQPAKDEDGKLEGYKVGRGRVQDGAGAGAGAGVR